MVCLPIAENLLRWPYVVLLKSARYREGLPAAVCPVSTVIEEELLGCHRALVPAEGHALLPARKQWPLLP
ncbi:hypothetical protein GCM10027403_04470 [Arthrobacter tecti]